jgi:hypothetical protein
LHLVEAARSILDINGFSGAPSLDFLARWTLRIVYMRMTAPPHSAWIASSTLMHLIESSLGILFGNSPFQRHAVRSRSSKTASWRGTAFEHVDFL